jgi:hypothetical protein
MRTVSSPQVPGLVGGSNSDEELNSDLPGLLRFAGVDTDGLSVRFHQEVVMPTPNGDLVCRVTRDGHFNERCEVAERIRQALTVKAQRDDMFDVPRTPTGEVLYICTVPTDTIRWCAEQLHPAGEGATVAACVADEMVWATYISNGLDPGGHPLEYFGFSLDTTVSEMMRAQVVVNRTRKILVPA